MSSFNEGPLSSPGVFTDVHVEVHGHVVVPVRMDLLRDVEDVELEREVLNEAVRIAVSEKLGYFDAITVRPTQTAPPPTTTTTTTYTADLDLPRLGNCLESIQLAYEHVVEQLADIHALAQTFNSQQQQQQRDGGDGAASTTPNNMTADALLARVLRITTSTLRVPANLVEAAARGFVAEAPGLSVAASSPNDFSSTQHTSEADVSTRVVCRGSQGEEITFMRSHTQHTAGGPSSIEADEDEMDYEAQGYTRL